MIYKFFDKKFASSDIKNEITQNQQLAEELHKPIIRKFKNINVYLSFKDNFWGEDLADMQLISKFSKGIRFSLCVTDILVKDKKDVTILHASQKIFDDSKEN